MSQQAYIAEIAKGDPITAKWLNKLVESANRQSGGGGHCIVTGAGTFFRPPSESRGGFLFKNGGEDDIPAYGIIRLNGTTTAGHATVLDGRKPNTFGSQYSHFINGPRIISPGKTGRCYAPATESWQSKIRQRALYDSADGQPAFGEFWGPRASTYKLKRTTGGFMAIGDVDTTTNTALFVQAPFLSFLGQAAEDIPYLGSGDITVTPGFTLECTAAFGAVVNLAVVWVERNFLRGSWDIVQTNTCP